MTFLIVLHTIFCVFLVLVILLQPGKGDAGIGFGSSSQSIFGSRGAGNFLTKTTGVCAVLFLFTSFLLTRSRLQEHTKSVIDSVPETPAQTTPAPAAGKSDAPAKTDGAAPKKQ